MKNWFRDQHRIKRASQYIMAAILSALILCFLLKLWRADLHVPLHYNGDALLHSMFIKGIVDNGWYWKNPTLGAPNGLEMYDFPAVDNSAAIIIAHNHPSGESTPSEADIKITRDLIRAGQLLKIEVLDHIVIGNPNHSSLRSLGYFYSA